MDTVIEFDLTREEKPIRIRNPKTGEVSDYVVREMDGTLRDSYLSAQAKRVNVVEGKVTGIREFDGMTAMLLTRCLYKQPENTPVTAQEVQAWPAKVQAAIHEIAERLNGLGKFKQEAEANAGNG